MLTDELIPGIARPDTAAAACADEVAIAYCTPAIVNHCLRSYVWAASYATNGAITFDPELTYVSSMLHDIGLVPEFDSHTVPFEDAGGHVAWVVAVQCFEDQAKRKPESSAAAAVANGIAGRLATNVLDADGTPSAD